MNGEPAAPGLPRVNPILSDAEKLVPPPKVGVSLRLCTDDPALLAPVDMDRLDIT